MINSSKNYSLNKLVSNKRNDLYLDNIGLSENQLIQFVFDIDPNVNRLKMQAETFAINFKTHGAYSFNKLFNCREEAVVGKLRDLYIYSFAKAYYSILFPESVRLKDMCGYCFSGHSKFYELCQIKDRMQTSEGVSIYTGLKLGSTIEKRVKFALLIKQFNFLKEYSETQSSFGSYLFYIPALETLFSKLVEDYYAKRADGEPEPFGNSKKFRQGHNLPFISPQDNEKGKVEITKLVCEASQEICKDECLPLTNTFFKENCDEILFMEVNGNHEIMYNTSFFPTLANFFVIKMNESSEEEILRYYKNKKLTVKQNFLINSEVYVNTGIKCSFCMPSSGDSNTDKPLGSLLVKDLVKKLRDFPNALDDVISIYHKIDQILEEWEELTETTEEKEIDDKGKS